MFASSVGPDSYLKENCGHTVTRIERCIRLHLLTYVLTCIDLSTLGTKYLCDLKRMIRFNSVTDG